MSAWHSVQADRAHQRNDEDQRDLWLQDVEKIEDIIARLKGISLRVEGDFNYDPYEDKSYDKYLSGISDDSLEVLKHFGGEAPDLLNRYSCAVEDALIEQVKKVTQLAEIIEKLTGQNPCPDNAASIQTGLQSLKNDMHQAN